jgi:hypothetical protein
MSATLDLPITLKLLTPEQITWIAAKSAQLGLSTDEVAKQLIATAAAAAGFTPSEGGDK